MNHLLEKLEIIELTGVCDIHGAWAAQYPRLAGNKPLLCPECRKSRERSPRHDGSDETGNPNPHRALTEAGVPLRFWDATLDQLTSKTAEEAKAIGLIREYAQTLETAFSDGRSLVLLGELGTGKTHCAAAIGLMAMAAGKSLQFTHALALAEEVKATYGHSSVDRLPKHVTRRYVSTDLLIIDEVGRQRGTFEEQLIIGGIIDERYNLRKPTIVATNLDVYTLSKLISARSVDRLAENNGLFVVFKGTSWRRTVRGASITKLNAETKTQAGKARKTLKS